MPVDLTPPPPNVRPARQAKVAGRNTAKQQERTEAVDGAFQLAGFGLIVTRQYADAGAIGLHKDGITRELVALADKHEGVAKAIDYLTEAGPYAGLIVAIMPLAIQIAANHGLVKAELVSGAGVVPPQALESQVKADMARQAAQALRMQQEAEQELARIAADMAPQTPPESPTATPNGKPARNRQAEKLGAE